MRLRTDPIVLIDLHHTGANELNTKAVRDYHVNIRRFGDIGYNMVIEPDGTVGIGRDPKWDGAHDLGIPKGYKRSMNQISFSVGHIGNFEKHQMPEAQFISSTREVAKLCTKYGILPKAQFIRRHLDQFSTICPGKFFPYSRYVNEVARILTPIPVPVKDKQYMIVAANPSLNVRSSPKVVSGNIIGSLPNGSKVRIGWVKDGWANIYFGDHGGFVSAKYLK